MRCKLHSPIQRMFWLVEDMVTDETKVVLQRERRRSSAREEKNMDEDKTRRGGEVEE